MSKPTWVVILLYWLSLSACALPATPPPTTPTRPTEVVRSSPTLSVGDVIATLRRSGGLAAVNETFVIKADGAVVAGPTTRQTNGGASAAARLAEQLAATGVYDVAPGKYMPASPCCDRYTYEVTFVKDGKAYAFTTMDASETAPPALFKAIGLIQQYIATAN